MEIEIAATPAGNDPSEARPVLRLTNLSKSFGGVQALDRVSLQVGLGEVHGLLGQNGSGKSTLIKILSGFHAPDPGGQLWIDGQEIGLPVAPGALREHGLSFVHQHLGLIPSITVLENLLVYDLAIADRWAINWRAEAQRARELFARYDIKLDPLAGVSRLSPVERAQLAIVRAFDWLQRTRGGKGASGLLVLDEPTPFLPAHDVDVLFRLVRDIVRAGTGVIFVSHDIDEVLEITTRATVLRDGRIAGTFDTATMDKRAIVHLIVGQHVDLESMRPPAKSRGARAATIRNLRGGTIRDFSAELGRGELIAKWFQTSPSLMLLDEPCRRKATQGVDVGARAQVFSAIAKAAEEGATVLCASSDYEQLSAICDRVLVFSRGEVIEEIAGDRISKSAIAEACYRSA